MQEISHSLNPKAKTAIIISILAILVFGIKSLLGYVILPLFFTTVHITNDTSSSATITLLLEYVDDKSLYLYSVGEVGASGSYSDDIGFGDVRCVYAQFGEESYSSEISAEPSPNTVSVQLSDVLEGDGPRCPHDQGQYAEGVKNRIYIP